MPADTLTFSPEQTAALDAIAAWYEDPLAPQVYRLFGPAGTGKTTIARAVPGIVGSESPRFAAFAGKAASVLRRKGCEPASTLHSLIYKPKHNSHANQARALREQAERADDATLRASLEAQAAEHEALAGKPMFEINEGSDFSHADLLICDEVSMVGKRLAEDILSFGVRVLVLGDPEQLPPIEGAGYFTNHDPDILLTEIHRQALDSPVLSLAHRIRQSTDANAGLTGDDYSASRLDLAHAGHLQILTEQFDQIICGKRATRWAIIEAVRATLGRPAGVPVPGDRVMCVANNKDRGVFNGQQFEVVECDPADVFEDTHRLVLLGDDGALFETLADPRGFVHDEGEKLAARVCWKGPVAGLTFAHAITAHKAQGSEWARVLVVDESASFAYHARKEGGEEAGRAMRRRFLYTAVTRAAEAVTLIRI